MHSRFNGLLEDDPVLYRFIKKRERCVEMASLDDIQTMGILGAGQMGGGIAQVAATAGLRVLLIDASLDLADNGKRQIAGALAKQVDKGMMVPDARDEVLARIQTAGAPDRVAECDFVIEAATERLDLKIALLRKADAALAPGKWLASNTSSISLTKLAAATSRPDRDVYKRQTTSRPTSGRCRPSSDGPSPIGSSPSRNPCSWSAAIATTRRPRASACMSVSYTHLDVYKRQGERRALAGETRGDTAVGLADAARAAARGLS